MCHATPFKNAAFHSTQGGTPAQPRRGNMMVTNKKGKDVAPAKRHWLTCKELWNEFEQRSAESSPRSRQNHRLAWTRFFSFFKEQESIADLTQNRMLQWKEFLLQSLSPSTAAATVRRMKTVFRFAVMKGWIADNPLQDISIKYSPTRKDRRFFTRDEYLTLLEHCPNQEWRVILALARYAGLRCPSEVMQLRWRDINWKAKGINIYRIITARNYGSAGRNRSSRSAPCLSFPGRHGAVTIFQQQKLISENNGK